VAYLKMIDTFAPDNPMRREFQTGLNFLAHFYMAELGKVKTELITKVIVQFCMDDETNEHVLVLLNVAFVDILFDFNTYWKSEDSVRRKLALDSLHRALLIFAKKADLPTTNFERAYITITDKGIQNIKSWGGKKFNPAGELQATLRYDFGPWAIQVYVVVFNEKGKELGAVPCIPYLPDSGYIKEVLGTFRWLDDKTVQVTSKDGLHVSTVDISRAIQKIDYAGRFKKQNR
jgi:hypothetical protein